MHRPSRKALAAVGAAAVLGAGGGAGIYAGLDGGGGSSAPAAPASAPVVPAAASKTALSVHEIYANDGASVVEITVTSQGTASPFPFGPGSGRSEAQGSGFVYDADGHIVTNQHVVDGADSVTVTFADGTTRKATVVGSDASTDVAVLKVDLPSGVKPLALADSNAVQVGDPVVAIGSPEGLQNSVTTGVVSALHRTIDSPNNFTIQNAIQTDAAINHGNSGGVLLDSYGDVIGVTAQIESQSGGNEGIGFAIPSNTVKSIASQLIASGKAEHAYLGVGIDSIPSDAASSLGEAAGAAVTQVRSGSPADKAGLQASTGTKTVAGQSYPTGGDVITAVDGTKVGSADELQQLIDGKKPGDTIQLTVVRDGKTRTVSVTLGTRPS